MLPCQILLTRVLFVKFENSNRKTLKTPTAKRTRTKIRKQKLLVVENGDLSENRVNEMNCRIGPGQYCETVGTSRH